MLRGEADGNVSYWTEVLTKLHRNDVAKHLTEAAEGEQVSRFRCFVVSAIRQTTLAVWAK
jgi:hypothetical protein